MSKTGESYTAARSHVADKREKLSAASEPPRRSSDTPSEQKLIDATGRGWDEWFEILDRWGAREHAHIEIARYLADEMAVPMWWTQSITVAYERARGMRAQRYQRSDGVFAVSTSKTVAAPIRDAYAAVVDDDRRSAWLTDGKMMFRSGTEAKTAHFDWDGGPTRVHVWFTDKDGTRTTVAVEHERLDGAEEAEAAKPAWTARLAALKAYLGG
jgi:hypothetical protein